MKFFLTELIDCVKIAVEPPELISIPLALATVNAPAIVVPVVVAVSCAVPLGCSTTLEPAIAIVLYTELVRSYACIVPVLEP